MSLKKEIVHLLNLYADLMEFSGENKFKINAFRFGANTIRRIEGEIEEKINDNSLNDVKGIGKGIIGFVSEYYDSGTVKEFEDLRAKVPDGILDVMLIRGLGAKKVRMLYDALGVTNLSELEVAAKEDKITSVKGFSKKSQDNILEEIKRKKKSSGYVLLSMAIEASEQLKDILKGMNSVKETEVTGELRRGMEIISKISFLILVTKEMEFEQELSKLYKYNRLESNLSCKSLKLNVDSRTEIILHYYDDPSKYESLLFATTGSDKFLEYINYTFDTPAKDETEILKKHKLPFIIPEMREQEYFNAPSELRVNSDLNFENLQGLIHFHTTASDGLNTLSEMNQTAEKLGFEYSVVCDHSKAAFYANGLTEDRVLKQAEAINKLNSKSNIKIFHGIESDILANGFLDYENDFMKNFDFIVASVHSRFKMTEEEMTSRVITAIENPYTDLLGHPTGRLLLSREPYKINMKKVMDACVKNDVAIEINANAHRLDLDWRLIYYALEKGCKFSINADAHSTEGILDTHYGIKIARKGGLQCSEVINCYNISEFKIFLNRKISRNLK